MTALSAVVPQLPELIALYIRSKHTRVGHTLHSQGRPHHMSLLCRGLLQQLCLCFSQSGSFDVASCEYAWSMALHHISLPFCPVLRRRAPHPVGQHRLLSGWPCGCHARAACRLAQVRPPLARPSKPVEKCGAIF